MVKRTHIVLADLTDEVLGFVHGSRCWSEHRESLLVHLVYRHTLKRQTNLQFQHSVTQSALHLHYIENVINSVCLCGWLSDLLKCNSKL